MLLRFLVVISLLLGFTSDSFSKSITLDQKKTVRIRGMVTAAILLKGKEMLNISKDEREITLLINSQGGQVNTGLMFIDMMEIVKARGTKIRCVVPNLAASMAFHILAHCDSRYTLPSAILLWHPAKQSCLMCAMSAEDMIYSGTQLQLIEQPQNEYLIKAMNVPEEFFYFHYEHETLWAAYVLNNQVPGFIEIVKDIQGLDDFESMDSTTQNFYDTLADRMAKDF